MKNLCKVLLALIGLFPSITGYAYDIEVDGIYYSYIWDVDSERELSVEAGEPFCYTGDVVIPATVSYGGETYTVTKLGARCFEDGTASHNLTSVKLPATLKAIGDFCFYECLAIDHIELPQSLKCIGSSAFYCTSIDSIYLPANVEFLGTDRYTSGESAYCGFGTIGDFRRIIVDENNPYLVSIDDVVYNKDKTELLHFPTRKGLKTFEVPYGVTHIEPTNVNGGYFYYDGGWRSGNDLQLLILPETAEVCNESYSHLGGCARNLAVRSPQPCPLARPYDQSYNLYVPKGSLEAYRNDVNWGNNATIREFKTDGDAIINMTWDATLGEVLINDQKATSTSKVTPLSYVKITVKSYADYGHYWVYENGVDVTNNFLWDRHDENMQSYYSCEFLITDVTDIEVVFMPANFEPNFSIYEEGHDEDECYIYNAVSPTEVELRKIPDYVTEFTVPEYVEYKGISYKVVGVSCWLGYESCLEKIEFPSHVKYLHGFNFDGPEWDHLPNIKKVILNEGLEVIGAGVFKEIPLDSIILPQTLKEIGNSSFWGVSYMNIPPLVTYIHDIYADELVLEDGDLPLVGGMPPRKLKKLYVGRDISLMGIERNYCHEEVIINHPAVFSSNFNDGECIPAQKMTILCDIPMIPRGYFIRYVGERPHEKSVPHTQLKEIEIKGVCEKIGSAAFALCSDLERVVLPEGLLEIDINAFAGCKSLKSITIPSTVQLIANGAFTGCTSLERVEFVEGGTEVEIFDGSFDDSPLVTLYYGKNVVHEAPVFSNIPTLRKIEIAENIREIPDYEFAWNVGLDSLVCYSTQPPIVGKGALDKIDRYSCELVVPEGAVDLYDAATTWTEFIYPDAVESIEDDIKARMSYDGEYLTVSISGETTLTIYTIDGKIVYNDDICDEASVRLPRGIYIVKIDNRVIKTAF